MISVSKREFLRSRNRQEQVAKNIQDDSARRMVLFYAVECGAKYQYMENHKCQKSNDDAMKNFVDKNRHDIQNLLKEIGIEAKCSFPIVISNDGQSIDPGRYQEMWRYGINCKNSNEIGQQIEKSMKEVLALLHEIER